MANLQIPTIEEIQIAVAAEFHKQLTAFFSKYNLQPQADIEDIGKGAEFASQITGKAVQTIYDLAHQRAIPHFKKGKDLYFSRRELLNWIQQGRRKTQSEIAAEAENRQPRAFNRNR